MARASSVRERRPRSADAGQVVSTGLRSRAATSRLVRPRRRQRTAARRAVRRPGGRDRSVAPVPVKFARMFDLASVHGGEAVAASSRRSRRRCVGHCDAVGTPSRIVVRHPLLPGTRQMTVHATLAHASAVTSTTNVSADVDRHAEVRRHAPLERRRREGLVLSCAELPIGTRLRPGAGSDRQAGGRGGRPVEPQPDMRWQHDFTPERHRARRRDTQNGTSCALLRCRRLAITMVDADGAAAPID